MPYRFDDKVILITGAASGIGRATAKKLSSLGAILVLSDINHAGLLETAKACARSKQLVQEVNVGNYAEVQSHIEDAVKGLGKIDHVFNCAGVNPTSYDLQDTTEEYWDKLVNTNLKGVYNVTKAVIPHLNAPGATFVNVSSILGLHPSSRNAIYCATKYAVVGFSKSMALELGPKGIRTNIIAPGYIDTPTNFSVVMGAESVKETEKAVACGRLGTAEEIADVVAFLFSDEARYMNGSVIEVNGGTG